MAAALRAIRSLAYREFNREKRLDFSTENRQWRELQRTPRGKMRKVALGILAGLVGGCGVVLYFLNESVQAMQSASISPPRYPWKFKGTFKSFDHAALRRGWLVYRTACHTCHSLRYIRFRDLINVTHTMEEATKIAAEFEVKDGPDAEGDYFMRPGKISDLVPSPYPNEEAARAANFGAYPPDLTLAVHTRSHGADHLFSLLTGWMEPPAGVRVEEGQYFNLYFPGGLITMAQMLYPGMVDYDDGTPATESQMAKDVTEFLSWTASQEHDTRKIMTIKGIGVFAILLVTVAHLLRQCGAHLRSRQIAYVPRRKC